MIVKINEDQRLELVIKLTAGSRLFNICRKQTKKRTPQFCDPDQSSARQVAGLLLQVILCRVDVTCVECHQCGHQMIKSKGVDLNGFIDLSRPVLHCRTQDKHHLPGEQRTRERADLIRESNKHVVWTSLHQIMRCTATLSRLPAQKN